jgi:glycerate kinase
VRLICPTAFKGTFSPLEAARRLAAPGDSLLPLSDGGDGFLECLEHALGGRWHSTPAPDPFGRIRWVPWLELPDGTACVESAKVIGLAGLEHPDPLRASSRGLGHVLRLLAGAPAIWVGLGGTATIDGGRDWKALRLPPTLAFCDVSTGLAEAVRVFGPQKGARPEDLPALTERLLGLGLPTGPRSGCAGGLGARLLSLGAELVDGAERMLEVCRFADQAMPCDAVVTGEGRLDASTLEGKLPLVVARHARGLGKRVIGHFGSKGEGWEAAAGWFDELRFGLEPISPD